jgi:hypothetical protein
VHEYDFYLKTGEGEFKKVRLELRTTGGDCKHLVKKSLGTFFAECGLPDQFDWDKGAYVVCRVARPNRRAPSEPGLISMCAWLPAGDWRYKIEEDKDDEDETQS